MAILSYECVSVLIVARRNGEKKTVQNVIRDIVHQMSDAATQSLVRLVRVFTIRRLHFSF